MNNQEQPRRLDYVTVLVMDFDGVHTNGFVYVNQKGEEMVRCSRRDSLGLNMLRNAGIKLFVISKEKNPVVVARCDKLGVECFSGVQDAKGKKDLLEELAIREGVTLQEVAFIGDDVNDIEAMQLAGVSVTVSDAEEYIKEHADIVLSRKGGEHALRELCDMMLRAKGLPIRY